MKKCIWFILFLSSVTAFSCKTSQKPGKTETAQAEKRIPYKKKKEPIRGNSLIGELRRLPGVQVSGNDTNGTVMLGRGSASIKSNQGVLFVIDGIRLGTNLSQAATAVNVQQIKNIRLLKDNEASGKYGLQGANGVIEINTLKEPK
jgi:hypothetical protein